MTTVVGTSVAMIDGVDVDAVAAAVQACPAVSGLYGGRGDAIASYLPGRRVAGIEVVDGEPVVHVRSRWGIPAQELLGQVAAALRPVIGSRHFEVVVADIDDPDAGGADAGGTDIADAKSSATLPPVTAPATVTVTTPPQVPVPTAAVTPPPPPPAPTAVVEPVPPDAYRRPGSGPPSSAPSPTAPPL